FVKRQTRYHAADLNGVERFVLKQSFGQSHKSVFVFDDDLSGAIVLLGDYPLHFLIDLNGRVFAVILMVRYVAAQEDLLLFLAEGERAELRHAEFAYHLARKFGGAFYVVRRAGSDVIEEDLFGDAAAHHNRDLAFDILASVSVPVGFGKLLRDAQSH